MMPRIISRRSLFATAIGGAMVWLSSYVPFFIVSASGTYSIPGYRELIALCSDLRCPRSIGKACLLALPADEGTLLSLSLAILADVSLAGGNHPSPDMLARAIWERSRTDFLDGRVVTVDAWVLSLTETRIYALTTLLL